MKKITLGLADDHRIFLDGLQRLLADDEQMEVLWLAMNGREVLENLRQAQPDVLLLDIQMPEMNGIETLEVISREYPGIKVIILSMLNDRPYIEKLYSLGASGYLLKNTGNEELLLAIRTVQTGGRYFSAAITTSLLERTVNPAPQVVLTKRELEVLTLLAKEYSSQEIAEKLFLSVETVNSHRKNLMRKLDAKNAVGLIKYALQAGLV